MIASLSSLLVPTDPTPAMNRCPVLLVIEVIARQSMSSQTMRLLCVPCALAFSMAALLGASATFAVWPRARTALDQVIACVFVASRAVRFQGMVLRECIVKVNVLLSGDGFDVIHVAAPLVFAKMMEVMPRRDWSDEALVHKPMDDSILAFATNGNVAMFHRFPDPLNAGCHWHQIFKNALYSISSHIVSSQG